MLQQILHSTVWLPGAGAKEMPLMDLTGTDKLFSYRINTLLLTVVLL